VDEKTNPSCSSFGNLPLGEDYTKDVQPRCNCGALLPEDARFCHKCGKPQYEEDIVRLSAADSAPAPLPPPLQLASARLSRIGFRNPRAVGITLTVAALSLVALSVVAQIGVPPLGLLILCAAGFAAARLYRNRTAEPLTPIGGATLGAMTYLWLFVVAAIGTIFTLSTQDGRNMLKAAMPQAPELDKILNDPSQFMVVMVAALVLSFFIGTLAAAFGGMLAARLQPRGGQSS
jgi:hypothetical protein